MIISIKNIVIQTFLSLLILLSGIGFKIEKHLCLNHQETERSQCCFLEESTSCNENSEETCCDDGDFSLSLSNAIESNSCEIGCCVDEVIIVKDIKIEQQAQEKFTLKIPFLQKETLFFTFNFQTYFTFIKNIFSYSIHFSPTFSRNILFQVFRI